MSKPKFLSYVLLGSGILVVLANPSVPKPFSLVRPGAPFGAILLLLSCSYSWIREAGQSGALWVFSLGSICLFSACLLDRLPLVALAWVFRAVGIVLVGYGSWVYLRTPSP